MQNILSDETPVTENTGTRPLAISYEVFIHLNYIINKQRQRIRLVYMIVIFYILVKFINIHHVINSIFDWHPPVQFPASACLCIIQRK